MSGSTSKQDGGDEAYYEELTEHWPAARPSSRRAKRAYRRNDTRRIWVRGERLDPPDVGRLSRALLAAQRELAKAQTEAEAEATARREHGDGTGDLEP